MNISGSLSIKTATIGGKANGSYVDSDKFKASDLNFHLQVKVTNQIHEPPEYSIFNKISNVEKHEFPEVYGDCFISGWEEGGELNAVISMKVHDKSKIFEIKAGLEAEMSTPTVSGSIKADFAMEKNKLSKETETTISVNWSGGGSIKDPTKDWTIQTLKEAAAAFPDLVAVTPQRTYAILTNAGIYTRALLDHYMDYKAMWKDISSATYELKGGRATIEMARPGEETYALATIQPLPANQVDAKAFGVKPAGKALPPATPTDPTERDKLALESQALVAQQENHLCGEDHDHAPEPIRFPVFSPNFAGLIHARKVCRFEMAKIVNEVDLVAKNPKLSTDTRRDAYFLNPLIFEQLLPIVRSLSPDSAKLRVKDPNAAILLGYVPPVEEADALAPAVLANDLETLDATFRPNRISVWSQDQVIHGLRVHYAKNVVKSHGTCSGDASHVWALASDGSEIIVEVGVREGIDASGQTVISSISMATSNLRGFFSFSYNGGGDADEKKKPVVPCTLGVVWSKDVFVPVPTAALSTPICRNLLGLGASLRENIRRYKTLASYASYSDKFLMGRSAAALVAPSATAVSNEAGTKAFNALDFIDMDWTIKNIAFALAEGGKLAGLRVTYTNGRVVEHGTFEKQVWSCDVKSDLVIARITAGRAAAGEGEGYVDTVEFVRAEDAQTKKAAAWPLQVSTLRYLGEGSERVCADVCEVVEQAPRLGGNARWTIRGFYGEHECGVVSRLGVIWGRG
ncbi:hypothetical protein QBC40DRAFT_320121 [Triangularia verruculosa]|uniref:Jacalin-type lectin domain-containing protein n=1 Tax=Triangularia verruculosa TaxID=2587418 RepID=A0AAN7B059_9PEZI|nr:hypothetical protein QBC40DRAFT_320121 [Triangularia verruculosa]